MAIDEAAERVADVRGAGAADGEAAAGAETPRPAVSRLLRRSTGAASGSSSAS